MKRWAWWFVMVLGVGGLWRLSQVEVDDTMFHEAPAGALIVFGACMCLLYPRTWEE